MIGWLPAAAWCRAVGNGGAERPDGVVGFSTYSQLVIASTTATGLRIFWWAETQFWASKVDKGTHALACPPAAWNQRRISRHMDARPPLPLTTLWHKSQGSHTLGKA